jgi:RNA polymerase II subunit A-like phosphatase
MPQQAAILDDREDVWANAKNNVTGRPGEPPDNLLLVRPYHWKPFIGYADVNNASGQDLSKTDDSSGPTTDPDKEEDVQLLWTADILRRLHERYYSPALSQEERECLTVPGLLQSMRKETLLRFPQVKVVLSGLIPINKQNKQSQIRPQVIRYSEELGAEVLPSVCPEVTHVVAARDNSEKIKQARREVPGCYIVRTSWLMECWWSISRRDVRPHHMGPMPSQQHVGQRALLSSKKDTSLSNEGSKDNAILLLDSDEEEDEDDDFEDDFAADLEKEMMMKGK